MDAGFELRSLLAIYKGYGTRDELSHCYKNNPTVFYPIDPANYKFEFEIFKDSDCDQRFKER